MFDFKCILLIKKGRGTSNPQSYEDIDQPPSQQQVPGGNAPFFTPYR